MEPQQPKTHWKKMVNTNYIGAHDLQPGQELIVTIESISRENVKNQDGKEEQCVVMRIKGAKKPMILNKTNMRIITKLFGTPYIEDWSGRKVIIYAAKVRAFGEMIEALRIKNQLPQ